MSFRLLLWSVIAALVLAACTAGPAARERAYYSADRFVSNRITVETQGQGPDIILVPGLASHRDVWAGVAESLDDHYRLHLVQLYGFAGLPPRANADGLVAGPVAEEIARYIRQRRLDDPAVIGHSMGGTIGMMLAARHPGLVGRLMVVDMFPSLGAIYLPPDAPPGELQRTADAYRAQILADPPGTPTGTLEQMFPRMTRVDSLRPMLLEGVRGTDRTVAANAFAELILIDLRPELARVTVPVTVLYVQPPEVPLPPAEFDRIVRESFANAPRSRVIRVEDSNHFIMFDQPARFLAEVDAFMRQP